MDWWADGIATLGLIGGAIGFFTARSARKEALASNEKADEARREATVALQESAAATVRIAEVAEAQARPPEPAVDFQLYFTPGEAEGMLLNVGDAMALGMTLRGYPEEQSANARGVNEPMDVAPNDQFDFLVMQRAFSTIRQVEASWFVEGNPERQRRRIWLT